MITRTAVCIRFGCESIPLNVRCGNERISAEEALREQELVEERETGASQSVLRTLRKGRLRRDGERESHNIIYSK